MLIVEVLEVVLVVLDSEVDADVDALVGVDVEALVDVEVEIVLVVGAVDVEVDDDVVEEIVDVTDVDDVGIEVTVEVTVEVLRVDVNELYTEVDEDARLDVDDEGAVDEVELMVELDVDESAVVGAVVAFGCGVFAGLKLFGFCIMRIAFDARIIPTLITVGYHSTNTPNAATSNTKPKADL
ncbi:MAG: hypothetical protein KGH50_03165 [Candidatus Micrarchaeota archaeon]|nr:hypothetical protein [Candidatus Micrarchaeota archaeon]